MKTLLRSLLLATVVTLTGFMLWGVAGCSTLTKINAALTGQDALVTVEAVGGTVNKAAHIVAKAYHNGDITAAQWAQFAAAYARYLPIYEAEKNAIEKGGASATPSSSLVAVFSDVTSIVESFKLPATATPAK